MPGSTKSREYTDAPYQSCPNFLAEKLAKRVTPQVTQHNALNRITLTVSRKPPANETRFTKSFRDREGEGRYAGRARRRTESAK